MNYDEEFGPNIVLRCTECSVVLLREEICWCDPKLPVPIEELQGTTQGVVGYD